MNPDCMPINSVRDDEQYIDEICDAYAHAHETYWYTCDEQYHESTSSIRVCQLVRPPQAISLQSLAWLVVEVSPVDDSIQILDLSGNLSWCPKSSVEVID